MLKLTFTVLFFLLPCATAYANEQPSIFELGLKDLLDIRIVSSASGYAQPIADAPATVSIIHAEQWRAQGASTLSEAIQALPGVYLSKVQTGVTKPKISLRGLSGAFGEQILILIDGKPFRQMINGGTFYAQRIPLINFERIEVVRGPGSAIYGADAMGGVINLISYEEGKIPSALHGRVGSFGTVELGLSHHLKLHDNTFQFGLEYQSSDDDEGKRINSDWQTVFDQRFGSNASLAPGFFDEHYEIYGFKFQWFRPGMRLDVYDWRNFDSGVGAGVAQSLDSNASIEQHVTRVDFNKELGYSEKLKTDLRLSYNIEHGEAYYHIFPPGAVLPIGEDGNANFVDPVNLVSFPDGYIGVPGMDNKGYSASITQLFDVNDSHFLRWEVGYEFNQVLGTESKNFGPDILDGSQDVVDGTLTEVTNTEYSFLPLSEREIFYLSLQDEWKISDGFRATVGLRYDKYTDFGETVNPRIGLIWTLNPNWKLKLFSGSAFRAPSFVELYTANNPATIGNPGLEPEKVQTLDSGFSLNYSSFRDLQLSTTFFQFSAEELIKFTADASSGTQVAQNVGEQDGYGAEMSAHWLGFKSWTFSFNYSFLHSEDEARNRTADVPKHMANLLGHWRPNNEMHFFLGAKWLSDFARGMGDSRPEIEDYIWVTSRVEYRFDNIFFSLSAKNLLDEDARSPSNGSIPEDYPLHGRQLMLETRYEF